MAMRIRRTIDIAMTNYSEVVGACAFSYEGNIAYATENMQIQDDVQAILEAWNTGTSSLLVKHLSFVVAQATNNSFVAINPDGAISLICGTGKGVWFVAMFAPLDANKNGILNDCIQAAKNLETSVSIFDV
ncbi:MAG: hypothetical protein JSW61_10175 [Candidatus Thorarchaeota archaeon]|nr:MAG: hypothetical protein JSW61_10175 [Candidatus Thorarchaeota archaeon]